MPPSVKNYLSANEATALLGIRKQTLYAYVSRGWVRSVAQDQRKERLYLLGDLERLRTRAQVRAGHESAAASAMNWGEPIIATSITEICSDGPHYRGYCAVELAQCEVSFEAVAELLWNGEMQEPMRPWITTEPSSSMLALIEGFPKQVAQTQLIEVFALVTLHLAMGRGPTEERVLGGRTFEAARQVIQTLAGCFGLLSPASKFVAMRPGESLAAGLIKALGARDHPDNVGLLNSVLVLLADHELPPGTMAARVAASSGSALHSCIAAAIATSSGSQVARLFDQIDAFVGTKPAADELVTRATRLVEGGAEVPGFEHPLYPRGDPRAYCMRALLKKRKSLPAAVEAICDYAEIMESSHGLKARYELILGAVCRALGLPRHSPSALFVLSRTAGWVAHVVEQRTHGHMLRPRAKYINLISRWL